MNRYRLSEYFERARREEGIRAEEVERTVARHDDPNFNPDTGQRRWRIILPLFLALLLGCGGVIVAVQLGKGGYGDLFRETATDEGTSPDSLRSYTQEDGSRSSMPDEPNRDDSDMSPGIWGYRLKAGDRLRYERATLWNDIDREEREEYTEWADMTVERVGPNGEITLHVVITHGEGDTGMICRVTLSSLGEIRSSEMLYDPEHSAFLEKTIHPSFGGGVQIVPGIRAAREVERWLPVWIRRADLENRGEFSTRATRYDTGWSGTSPDFNDPNIHGDTISTAVYYSSAQSRGITADGPERPIWKRLRPGTSESDITMVPIITSGEDTAEVVRSVQFIDTTIETHHYVLLTPTDVSAGRIAWSDAGRTERVGRSRWSINDTLVFRSSDGAPLEWSSSGRSRGKRGLNVIHKQHIRLISSGPEKSSLH